jgi:hypothetical protein
MTRATEGGNDGVAERRDDQRRGEAARNVGDDACQQRDDGAADDRDVQMMPEPSAARGPSPSQAS